MVVGGSQVRIECSYDDTALTVMLWYQQKDGRTVTLIGYYYGSSATYEGRFEDEFQMTREDSKKTPNEVKGALTVRKAEARHSAVYFCAASSTVMSFSATPSL